MNKKQPTEQDIQRLYEQSKKNLWEALKTVYESLKTIIQIRIYNLLKHIDNE